MIKDWVRKVTAKPEEHAFYRHVWDAPQKQADGTYAVSLLSCPIAMQRDIARVFTSARFEDTPESAKVWLTLDAEDGAAFAKGYNAHGRAYASSRAGFCPHVLGLIPQSLERGKERVIVTFQGDVNQAVFKIAIKSAFPKASIGGDEHNPPPAMLPPTSQELPPIARYREKIQPPADGTELKFTLSGLEAARFMVEFSEYQEKAPETHAQRALHGRSDAGVLRH